MVPKTYLSPQGRAVIETQRAVIKATLEAKRTERLQARLFPSACEAFKALGWSDSAAQELADIHVHGSKA